MNNFRNKTWKGFLKKGLVFCMIGVMALGLVACGGKDKKSDTKVPKTQTEQSKNKKTNKKPSSQTEKKDDADIEKPQNTTGADQNKTDDTKAQDGADKESDTKNSTQKKPTQRNSTKKNSTKKNSTVQKSNKSGSTT
ncbi:hypothetical protein MCI89_02050 [Muricomes sp. OA1]|uniref:Lipoprotein n=1 Tax=Hungatella hathewayi TaxID=154046 RepID=A0A3E2X1A5_9FIRM|nr:MULTISPECIES: hypothetical protein [Clostridia]MCH1971129.1 hypothetical protein [Muricomes sp. OA1]MRM88696.1 hypothetical protein [Faecalicatena contorta]RGC35058.1 hypothetical protein DWX41_02390 [Hungatella hathewayi]GKH34422.1 hypothetical protein CE91St64_38290 [Faecalicatena contorta]